MYGRNQQNIVNQLQLKIKIFKSPLKTKRVMPRTCHEILPEVSKDLGVYLFSQGPKYFEVPAPARK